MPDLKYRLPKGTIPSLSIVLCERRCWTSSIVSRRGRYPHLASSSARDDAGPQVSSPEGDDTLTEHCPLRETMPDPIVFYLITCTHPLHMVSPIISAS